MEELQRALCELSLKELSKHRTEMTQRGEAVNKREMSVAQREKEVAQREATAGKREKALLERSGNGDLAKGTASKTENMLANLPTPLRSPTRIPLHPHSGDDSCIDAGCIDTANRGQTSFPWVQSLQPLPLTTLQPPTPQMTLQKASTPGTGSTKELTAMFEQRMTEHTAGYEQLPPRVPSLKRLSSGSGASRRVA